MIKFLANENFPISSVKIIKEKGIDIVRVGDEFFGITDEEVIHFANSENRIILTFDSDYGELIFKKGFHISNGVVYFRWSIFNASEPGDYLLFLIDKNEINFNNRFTVIDRNNIRQKNIK